MKPPKVGLYITCLINNQRPSIGFASIALLEQAGFNVEVPIQQSCCGQPAINSGDDQGGAKIARQVVDAFSPYDYLVVPSGSCASSIKHDYPKLLADDPTYVQQAVELSEKVYELSQFLTDVAHYQAVDTGLNASYTYHDSCSGYRKLGLYQQPRQLLEQFDGLRHAPLHQSSECCGFGGLFSVKHADISNAIVSEKTMHIQNTQAQLLLGGDWSCLMNMAGKMQQQGMNVQAFHFAEVLAGFIDPHTLTLKAQGTEVQ